MTAASPSLGLSRIGQIAVTAHDLERAVTFYRDRLGMQFLFQVPRMAFFRCGEVTVMLAVPEPEFDHPTSIVYYEVADLDLAHRTLAERGVAFIQGPTLTHRAADHELWMAFFRDSEGNPLALMARRPLS
jgi:predicted enzyme related to lactoylglutathione lyase